jgi:Cu+-exporting ATPase
MWQNAMNENAENRASGATRLAITGMTCTGCARALERALSRVAGVERANVDFGAHLAVVDGTAAPVELIRAVEAAGYGASEA